MNPRAGRETGSRVTRDVSPETLKDLLNRTRRATLAFADGKDVQVLPVRFRFDSDQYQFAVRDWDAPGLDGKEVVVVVDAGGRAWFRLRGVSVRGMAGRIGESADPEGWAWFQIAVRRIQAWNYGSLREE